MILQVPQTNSSVIFPLTSLANVLTGSATLRSKSIQCVTDPVYPCRKAKSMETLAKEVKGFGQKLRRKWNELSSAKDVSKSLKKNGLNKDSWAFVENIFNEMIIELMRNESTNFNKSESDRRYPDDTLALCNMLHYYSQRNFAATGIMAMLISKTRSLIPLHKKLWFLCRYA